MSLEFREGHLDGVEVGAVRWKEEKPRSPVTYEALGPVALVAREVVENDHVAGLEGGCELGLHIGFEDDPVHRRVNDPWRDEAAAFEARHEGLCSPMAER